MRIINTRLLPQQLLLSIAVVSGMLGIINTDTVFSQTTSVVRILRVKPNLSTTFKSRESWYKQSNDIAINEKCSAKAGEKFFVSSIRKQIPFQDLPKPPSGNNENLNDYWEVTFEKPLPCPQQMVNNQTWFVYKLHVQELKGVLVP